MADARLARTTSKGRHQSCVKELFWVDGHEAGDRIVVNPPGNIPNGLVVMPIGDINVNPPLELRICNVTGAAIDAPNGAYSYAFFRG